MRDTITLDLSCPLKSTPFTFPAIIKQGMRENRDLLKLLPHRYTCNQYRITFEVTETRGELEAWLDLFATHYPEVEKELEAIKVELQRCEAEGFKKNNFGENQIVLADLKRHCDKTNAYYRWFYPDM